MTAGEVCKILDDNGVKYVQSVIPNDTGYRLTLASPYEGAIVNCFSTGKVNVQGHGHVAEVKKLLGL